MRLLIQISSSEAVAHNPSSVVASLVPFPPSSFQKGEHIVPCDPSASPLMQCFPYPREHVRKVLLVRVLHALMRPYKI